MNMMLRTSTIGGKPSPDGLTLVSPVLGSDETVDQPGEEIPVARIRVIADDGWIALDERITADDFASEHFRRHLMDRLGWAAGDAAGRRAAQVDRPIGDPERFRRQPLPV